MSLSRRLALAGASLAPLAARAEAPAYLHAILAALADLPAGPVLLNSYIATGTADFDVTQANAAYVYDNALAGLALLQGGFPQVARRIGVALQIAQEHDRFYTDGRLRNAYMAGAMSSPAKLPGWWNAQTSQWDEDPYQISTQTGPVAWAILLWAALGMAAPARRAAAWLQSQLTAPRGFYGGVYGFEPHPLKLTWQSTEQNTDMYVAATRLGDAAMAASAENFVRAMLNPATGRFNAGLGPAGATNPLLAADAGIWPYLAGLAPAATALAAIQGLQHGNGIGFSAASDGIWLEGTAFAALALRHMQNPLAAAFRATLAANIAPSGYLYATVAPDLSTGLTVGPSLQPGVAPKPFNYYRRPSLSATAWAAMAYNPLKK